MNVSRFASLTLRQLHSSFSRRVAPVLWAPCRNISTGRDHLKFGNVGGKPPKMPPPKKKKGIDISRKDSRDLDVLCGQWEYDPLHPLGDPDEVYAGLQLDRVPKSYINYIKNNGDWVLTMGLENKEPTIVFRFKLNKLFLMQYPDLGCYRVMAQKRDRYAIKFQFTTLTEDDVQFSFTTRGTGDLLFHTTKRDDGSLRTKVYKRVITIP